MLDLYDFIKSVNLVENRVLGLDYKVHKGTKLPINKKDNRFRFSTGIRLSDTVVKSFKKENMKKAFEKAYEHYLSLMDTVENKELKLFKDIAIDALADADSESTRRKDDGTKDYINILKTDVLPILGDIPLKGIKPSHIKIWKGEMGKQNISQSRFNKKYYVVNMVLSYALTEGYIDNNPIIKVKKLSNSFSKRKENNSKYFSKVEMKRILSATYEGNNPKERYKHDFIIAFMHVAFLSGARTGEILSLKWENVDFIDNTITYATAIRKGTEDVPKNGKPRTVPAIKQLLDVLSKYRGTKTIGYIFTQLHNDKPYKDSRSIVDDYYTPLLSKLDIPFLRLYQSRHTFVSNAYDSGVPLATISDCVGHSDTKVTKKHYLLSGNRKQDVFRLQLENLTA